LGGCKPILQFLVMAYENTKVVGGRDWQVFSIIYGDTIAQSWAKLPNYGTTCCTSTTKKSSTLMGDCRNSIFSLFLPRGT
jgi:hypothetical protein